MKLKNIRPLGRYKNTLTGKSYNIKTGRNAQRSTDHVFYLCRGTRVYIVDSQFYSNVWQKETPKFI